MNHGETLSPRAVVAPIRVVGNVRIGAKKQGCRSLSRLIQKDDKELSPLPWIIVNPGLRIETWDNRVYGGVF